MLPHPTTGLQWTVNHIRTFCLSLLYSDRKFPWILPFQVGSLGGLGFILGAPFPCRSGLLLMAVISLRIVASLPELELAVTLSFLQFFSLQALHFVFI